MRRPTIARALTAALALALAPLVAATQTLTVSAATSLTDALRELAPHFEAAHPGVTLRFNFAASGVLLQQVLKGAPADVLLSADPVTIDRGVQQQALDAATRRDFARNALVVVVPARGGGAFTALQGLARPDVQRIAIGKPASVPAGRYAREALEAAGLWSALEPRLVFADHVRQALDYVARGEVDAGFVYRTDALRLRDRVRIALVAQGHRPITYPAAVVAGSGQPQSARAFVEFLLTPVAQEVLARHGFERP